MANNQSDVAGNQNIVIQGVSWSNINITTQQLSVVDFAKELQDLLHKKPIFVIILSILPKNLKASLTKSKAGFDFDAVSAHYGQNYEDWKPYLSDVPLINLLKTYEKHSGFALYPLFIDNSNYEDEVEQELQDFINKIKLKVRETILISDALALSSEGNQLIAKEFNNIHIGGCLVPLGDWQQNANILQFAKKQIKKSFGSLYDYTVNYEKWIRERADNGLIHIDLEAKDKHTLFRRLTAIATLGLPEKRERQIHLGIFENEKTVTNKQ
jgi:hypothetical protein